MGSPDEAALVDPGWLARHLDDADVRVVDGSFHLPTSGRDPRPEYGRQHIPGAVFFDIDGICDRSTDLPHMLPSEASFGDAAGALGIGNRHRVIVYNVAGAAGAERVWWTFRVFGHDRVAVLDGGLGRWWAEGFPTDDHPVQHSLERFAARLQPALVVSAADLLHTLATDRLQVIDNRGAARFRGEAPEPRPVKRLGHIPGSVNIPFGDYFDAERHGCWRVPDELRRLFARAGINLDRPIVASCGSGVTASATAFAAFLLGRDDVAVYDGSWAEWGNRDDTPIDR